MRGNGIQDVAGLGAILCIGAHPDDETFLCGGILAAAAQAGQRTMCVTATHGEAGVQNDTKWPAAQLGDIRASELDQALAVLGVVDHRWLSYKDGACAQADASEAVRQIVAIVAAYKPDTVFTFGPDGMTGHDDHKAVSRWTTEALRQSNSGARLFYRVEPAELYEDYLRPLDDGIGLYFNIDKPVLKKPDECDLHIELPGDLVHLKLRALEAMPSQTERMMTLFPPDFLGRSLSVEAFVAATFD